MFSCTLFGYVVLAMFIGLFRPHDVGSSFLFPDMPIYLCSNIVVQLLSNYIYNFVLPTFC